MRNVILSFLCCFFPLALVTQIPGGTISGKVSNAVTREAISGASILLIGTSFGAATDENGGFELRNIPVGTYRILVSALGFHGITRTDVIVAAGKLSQVIVQLTEAPVGLEGMTITAEYFQKQAAQPLSLQTLEYEEIRRLPGGLEDPLRAVSIFPGVAQVQPGRNDLIVRGGSPSENLFVIDNLEIPNINHYGTQGAAGGPLSYVNLDFVSSTSFSSGGFGVRHGDRLSSVLTIDLRDGRTDRLGGKATVSATMAGVNVEGPLDERGSFLFSARRSYLDFVFKAAGSSFVPEYWDFLGKVTYEPGRNDNFTFLSIGAIDNMKLLSDSENKRYENSRIMYSIQNQVISGASWRHLLATGYTTVSFHSMMVNYDTRQVDTLQSPVFSNASRENETSLRAEVVMQPETHTEAMFGLQGKIVDFTSWMSLKKFYTNFRDSIEVNAVLDTGALKAAAYAQISKTFFHRLTVTFGERIDYFNLIEESFAAAPRLSATFAATPALNLNATIGRYYQAPSYIWLVAHTQNRKLSSIGTDQLVLGIDHYPRPDVKISLEAYRKRYFRYPVSARQRFLAMVNTGAGFGGSQEAFASFGIDPLTSGGRGDSFGVEFFLQKKLSDVPWYGLFSLTYSHTSFTPLDGISRAGSFDQRWIANIGAGYLVKETLEISGRFRFATGRPYTPYNTDGTQEVALFNAARVQSNHSLDLRVDRRWNFIGWNLIVYVDVQNVYNRKPFDVPIYDERRREVRQIGNRIGILPSVGISGEF